jgi:hypothetical protein
MRPALIREISGFSGVLLGMIAGRAFDGSDNVTLRGFIVFLIITVITASAIKTWLENRR